jgi:hypothetical protein
MANERRIRVPFPLPNSPVRDGSEVQVKESTERWTEVELEDGTVVRLKATLLGAVRIEGEWDAEGNPAYSLKITPNVIIASTPDHLRRPAKATPVQ